MFPVPFLRKIMSVWIVPCGVEISRGNSVAPRDVLHLPTAPQDLRHGAKVIAKDNLCKSGHNALWVPLTVEKEALRALRNYLFRWWMRGELNPFEDLPSSGRYALCRGFQLARRTPMDGLPECQPG